MDSSNFVDWSISNRSDVWLFLVVPCFIKIPVFNANSVDPDQMPQNVAFDLGLHCLPVTLFLDATHKWVRGKENTSRETTLTWKYLPLLPFLLRNTHKGKNLLPNLSFKHCTPKIAFNVTQMSPHIYELVPKQEKQTNKQIRFSLNFSS